MKTAQSISLALLFCSPALLAQRTSNPYELQGCLRRSGSQYVLVDRDGTWQQVSYSKQMKSLVGHEVKLTGKQTIRTIDTTPPGGASSAIERPYFQIESAQDVKPSCEGYAPLK
jgi:hypothetical protein